MDRRIQKTLQLLKSALVELIAEKAYDDITIQEILDRANVGRSTFYAHFENKDHLLRSILTLLNEQFEEGIEQLTQGGEDMRFEDNSEHMPLRALQFVEQNYRFFRAMLETANHGSQHNPLYDYLYIVMREHFRLMIEFKNSDPLRGDMAAHYYASAFIGALVWWLENDMVYPAKDFANLINQFTLPGLNEVFRD